MDGLAGIFFMFLPIKNSGYNSHCFHWITTQRDRQLWANQRRCCHASQRVIGRELSFTCIMTSRSECQRSKYAVLVCLSCATRHVYGRKLDIKKKQINVLNICQSNEKDLKITSRQDYSHLVPWISFKCSSSLNCTSNWILRGFLWSIYPYLLGRLQAIADIPLK